MNVERYGTYYTDMNQDSMRDGENVTQMDTSWQSSYVFAVDNASGWGERYFFTYFTQLEGRSTHAVALEVAVFIAIFVVSVIANVSIIICVLRFPDMRTVTNYFVLNLAAADLIFAFTIPAVAYSRIVSSWKLGDATCRCIPYVQFVSAIVLLWTLALISMDRHRCIVVPPYRSGMSPRQAIFFSAITWLCSAVVFSPLPFWFREITSEDGRSVCTLVFPRSTHIHISACFVMPVVILACLFPMAMLVYHYQRIFQKIISTRNTWASSCVMVSEAKECNRAQNRRQSELSMSDIFVPWPRRFSAQAPSSRHGSLSQHEEIRLNKHIKVVRVIFLNVVVVLLMWLPITLILLLIYVDGRRPTEDKQFFLRSHHFIAALVIAFLNTLINPVVYGVLSDNFRACLMRIWCNRSAEDEVNMEPSSGRNNVTKTTRKQSFINSVSEN